jgi:hypothetical protein
MWLDGSQRFSPHFGVEFAVMEGSEVACCVLLEACGRTLTHPCLVFALHQLALFTDRWPQHSFYTTALFKILSYIRTCDSRLSVVRSSWHTHCHFVA